MSMHEATKLASLFCQPDLIARLSGEMVKASIWALLEGLPPALKASTLSMSLPEPQTQLMVLSMLCCGFHLAPHLLGERSPCRT